jgi:hypothetical protein
MSKHNEIHILSSLSSKATRNGGNDNYNFLLQTGTSEEGQKFETFCIEVKLFKLQQKELNGLEKQLLLW